MIYTLLSTLETILLRRLITENKIIINIKRYHLFIANIIRQENKLHYELVPKPPNNSGAFSSPF